MKSTEQVNIKKFSPKHLTFTLEEYKALRVEISSRSREQMQCITYSLGTIGVITGLLIKNGSQSNSQLWFLLLILPWFLSIFGIIWCDHHKHIILIGKYLSNIAENMVEEAEFLRGWDNYLQQKKQSIKLLKRLALQDKLLPIFYFFIPCVLSVSYYLFVQYKLLFPLKIELMFYYSIIILDIILMIILIVSWYDSHEWNN